MFGQKGGVTDKLWDIAGALFAGKDNMFVGQRFALPGRNVVFLKLCKECASRTAIIIKCESPGPITGAKIPKSEMSAQIGVVGLHDQCPGHHPQGFVDFQIVSAGSGVANTNAQFLRL